MASSDALLVCVLPPGLLLPQDYRPHPSPLAVINIIIAVSVIVKRKIKLNSLFYLDKELELIYNSDNQPKGGMNYG